MEFPKVCPNSIHHFDAAELIALDILPPIAPTPARVIFLSLPSEPFGKGIGIYCGAFIASFPISSPNHLIGAIADSVILLAPRAAITAIQRITRARTFIIIVPIIPFPVLRTPETPAVFSEVSNQTVVSFISQNVNTVVSPVVSTTLPFSQSVQSGHVVPLLVAHITNPRNISPNASAADT